MAEKGINCFKCGGDGHFARNCPQSNPFLTQTTILATTAESPGISLVTVPKKSKRRATAEDLPSSATSAMRRDIWLVTVMQVIL